MPRQVSATDLRLVPGALAAWGVAWWLVAVGARVALAGVLVAAGLLAVLGALLLVRRAAPPRGLGQCVLVTACALAVLLGGAADLVARERGGAAGLAGQGATVEVVGLVVKEPVEVVNPWSGASDSVRTALDLTTVEGRGVVAPGGGRIAVLGDLSWGEADYGAEVRASGRLLPADPGDQAVATLVASGPPAVTAPPSGALRVVGALRTDLLTASDGLPQMPGPCSRASRSATPRASTTSSTRRSRPRA